MDRTILIPGAGGPAAISVIKSLKLCGFRGKIISTDSNELSAGFFLTNRGYTVPEAKDPKFIDAAKKIIKKENIDTILPTSGFDIFPYSKHKDDISKMGVSIVVNNYDVIEKCTDKLKFFEELENKFDMPRTSKNHADIVLPCIAKPLHGKGGRDVIVCNTKNDIKYVNSKFSEMIFQELLPGREYTIDTLSNLDGKSLVTVPRIRLETKAGISTKGRIVLDKNIQKLSEDLLNHLGIIGPACIQMKEDGNGVPRILELNPRFGGGSIFSTLAGANIPEMTLDLLDSKKLDMPRIKEITIVRYFEEIVV
ncbi:MAG: ATP-grasp domain-containing protein [Candidatus Aenigmarchaeota archaeon]|nr:ATP-grasp domain-containing protein [Candidatus Aenigmarchaeota archaeon]